MDHDTFQAKEVDALFDELDADASAAMSEHAASCGSCSERLERLRGARQRGLSVLMEPVPQNFESRIMAAVDAALAGRAADAGAMAHASSGGAPPSASGQSVKGGARGGGAKIISLFSRPSFAVAATFVLVLGAAAFLLQQGARSKSASFAPSAADEAPAIAAQSPAPTEPAATASGAATPAVVMDPLAASAVALAENAPSPDSREAHAARPMMVPPAAAPMPPPPMAGAMARSGAPSLAKATAPPPPPDPAFASAKRLYDAGRYAEALPRFEAIKATNPEADLYAARCIAKTRGCAAAAPRFDATADNNAGTETGSRARLESGECYQSMGQAQAARTRYRAAQDDGILSAEATRDLDALDNKPGGPAATATATAGTPGAAGRPASPKAAPRAPANVVK